MKVYGEQRVDVNKVRQWVVHFSSGDSQFTSAGAYLYVWFVGSYLLLAECSANSGDY